MRLLIGKLATQLGKAIAIIDSEWPKNQLEEMGVPLMEETLKEAEQYKG